MRLPEAKIKEAILHPDPEIRDRAISYFAKSFSPDPSLMPLVIKAVETHGRQDAYRLIGLSRDLPQTEETIAWVIDELNDEQTDQVRELRLQPVDGPGGGRPHPASTQGIRRSWRPATSSPTCERPSPSACVCSPGIRPPAGRGWRNSARRARTSSTPTRSTWATPTASWRPWLGYGQECEEKVRAVLSQKVNNYSHHPMKWLEPLVVRLAGQAHLESTIPLLIAKLQEDARPLNEECAEALTRIGTPAVLHAVAEAFPRAEHHFRLYATGPLEHIHSDLAVETCLHLLGQEKDQDLRRELAHALLCHFAREGIEAARRLLVGRELDFEEQRACGITCWKPAPSWGNGSLNTTSGWLLRRPRRQNTGSGSRSLKATPRVCCCSPSKS